MAQMFESTADEVHAAFLAAKNANAAVKTFLKREARAGDPSERFAKDFRTAISSGRAESLSSFVTKHYPKSEMYFLALSRYAHADIISATVEKVFELYAEQFNTTYEKLPEGGLKVVDAPKFKEIACDVVDVVKKELQGNGLNPTNFLIKSALVCIFEPEVLREVLEVLE